MKLLFDFSRVLLLPTDRSFTGSLNGLYKEHKNDTSFIFFNYYELNKELLNYLETHKKNTDKYIFTSETIQDAPEVAPIIKPIFKYIYTAIEIGIPKKDPGSFRFIVRSLNSLPDDILFIDDTEENISAAREAGLKTFLYKNNHEIIAHLENIKEN
jgi:HAD superfamily hydrolase (TIGR01509 family)